jgi:hypothetical protein
MIAFNSGLDAIGIT